MQNKKVSVLFIENSWCGEARGREYISHNCGTLQITNWFLQVNSLTAKSFRREQNSYFLVGTYSIST